MKISENKQPFPVIVDNLSMSYGAQKALESVSGTFEPGTLTAIIGPNGSGKSTFLKVLLGLLKPKKGSVKPSYAKLRQHAAYLPQQAEVDRSFPLRVEDFVCTGLWHKIKGFHAVSYRQHEQIHEVLEHLGLKGFEERTLDALSGGQFQRVLFARLMIQDKPIIFLDEPFTGIDQRTVNDLLKIILDWHKQGKTVVTILHDMELVKKYFSNAILLSNKLLAWDTTEKVLEHKDLWKVPVCMKSSEKSRGDS